MSDPVRIAEAVPKILAHAMADTDLSLIEIAAVLRVAAESCIQAQITADVAALVARNRKQ